MFPDYLDGLKVLEYTDKGHFGYITDYNENENPYEREICYLAVAQHKTGGDYYILSCDHNYDVITDGYFWSIEICKTCHAFSEHAIWHSK